MNDLFQNSVRKAIIAAMVLLCGCVAPMSYEASVPQSLPAGVEGEVHKDMIEISLPELTLLAQVQAIDWDGSYIPRPLGVWINIKPKNGSLKLETIEVRLKSDSDEALVPVAYLGPETKWFSPRAFAAGCGPRRFHTGIAISNFGIPQGAILEHARLEASGVYKASKKPVAIDSESCFMFWFDTDPMPDHKFIFSINGITQDQRQIVVPAMEFHKDKVTTIRSFP